MSWDSKEMADAVRERAAQAEEALRCDAMKRARQIADLLKSEYGAAKVLLYGSLVDGFFHESSDIVSIVCARDAQRSLLENAESRGVVI